TAETKSSRSTGLDVNAPVELGVRVRMFGSRAFSLVQRDHTLVSQPLHGSPPHPGIVESEPALPQLREVQQRVLEPPKRPSTLNDSREQLTGALLRHLANPPVPRHPVAREYLGDRCEP